MACWVRTPFCLLGLSANGQKHRGDIINVTVAFLNEDSEEKLTGKVRDHFLEFMAELKRDLTPEIILGACEQKIPVETVIDLLERTFLQG